MIKANHTVAPRRSFFFLFTDLSHPWISCHIRGRDALSANGAKQYSSSSLRHPGIFRLAYQHAYLSFPRRMLHAPARSLSPGRI